MRRIVFLFFTLFFCATAEAVQAVPARVVSLDLCTDRMLMLHAARAQVAALSPMHRRFPTDALQEDWPWHDGSLEQIVRLQPDLVITGEYNAMQTRQRLIALGYRVEILPLPTTPDEIRQYEERLLALIGQPPERATPPVPFLPAPATPRRLLLLGANGIGTGRDTFEDGILVRAGWTNYLPESGLVRPDLERIVADPPDAILWAAPDNHALANLFADHPALRAAVPQARWLHADFWRGQCPGPWTWALVRQLHQNLPQ